MSRRESNKKLVQLFRDAIVDFEDVQRDLGKWELDLVAFYK